MATPILRAAPITAHARTRNVRMQRDLGRVEAHAGRDLLEFVEYRIHKRRVESMRYIETLQFDALGLESRGDGLQILGGSRYDDVRRAVHGRDADAAAGFRNGGTYDVLRRKHGGHRPASRKRTHKPSTCDDQANRILKRKHAGNAGSRIFADAVPHHRNRLHAPCTPCLRERIFEREERGLRVGRVVQQPFCAVAAEDDIDQTMREMRAREFVTEVERIPEDLFSLIEALAHTDILCPLSR